MPQLDNYNLKHYYFTEGVLIKKSDVKDCLKEMKSKYRKQFKQRVEDYNKVVNKYLKFVKKKEDFENKFNFFNYGGELRAGANRPNRVGKLFIEDSINYVKGSITHTGREHEPIELNTWHKAIPNTAIKSFTITGNID